MKHRTAPPSRRAVALLLAAALFAASVVLSLGVVLSDARAATTETVSFQETATKTRLAGTWYRTGADRAVLLVADPDADRAALRAAALAFVRRGFDAFAVDLPGQGSSAGRLPFATAAFSADAGTSARLAAAVGDAVAAFLARSGFASDRVVLAGHGLGARAVLRFAAERAAGAPPFAGLVLIGVDASGSDAWLARLGPGSPGLPVALLSGTADDVLPPEAAKILYERLSGEDARLFPGSRGTGPYDAETWLSADGRALLSLHDGTPHRLAVESPALLAQAATLARDWTAGPASDAAASETDARAADARRQGVRIAALLLLALGAAATLVLLRRAPAADSTSASAPDAAQGLPSVPAALGLRLLLWVPALLAAALFAALAAGLSALLGFGVPTAPAVATLLALGGCGLAGLLAARAFPDTYVTLARPEGAGPVLALRLRSGRPLRRPAALAAGVGLLALLAAAVVLFHGTGGPTLAAPPVRLLWTGLLGAAAFPGFLHLLREEVALAAARPNLPARVAFQLLRYLPFFILPILAAALGSPSVAGGAIIGVVDLLLALAAGRAALLGTGRRAVAALVAALSLAFLAAVQGTLAGF